MRRRKDRDWRLIVYHIQTSSSLAPSLWRVTTTRQHVYTVSYIDTWVCLSYGVHALDRLQEYGVLRGKVIVSTRSVASTSLYWLLWRDLDLIFRCFNRIETIPRRTEDAKIALIMRL